MINGKLKLGIGIVLLAVLVLIPAVSAYRLLCLTYGESLPPDAIKPRYTCWHDTCQVCTTNSFYPTLPQRCYSLGACEPLGGGGPDSSPPNLIVNSPEQNGAYESRKVLFDLSFDEPSSIYWIDNINGRGRWKRICSKCEDSYQKRISAKEGFNDITIMAKDKYGNSVMVERQFRVDSKKPKIRRTYPRRGFASGTFTAEIVELNPESLVLHYGTWDDPREEPVGLFDDCVAGRKDGYWTCSVDVELSDFSGDEIEYWFVLEDIAGSVAESKHIMLGVDITDPVIVNDNFWEQGVGRYERYVYFDMEIDELNFDEVGYRYVSKGRERYKRLCSRLKNNRCVKKKAFRDRDYLIDVIVFDEAGNWRPYDIDLFFDI